ncbi:uncharacterized protein LOC119954435 [Scyliorhinus canicula]|uniref:uncharacterized protein LOC119954435 n=1 Tax=Scyliorhinus canicula TaxID=7830 RepID=UPI0018F6E5A9|nr:uncharacterized protein LOC119954435 [Scyliorhinus canicula]
MKLSDLTSRTVIKACKEAFARHGIPLVVMSNNGPCFYSQEWSNIAKQYHFQQITSSPHYPQSNGKVKKGVHVVKQMLCKVVDSASAFNLALLAYRATPLSNGMSPAQLLMNCNLWTTVPAIHVPDLDHLPVLQKMQQIRTRQKTTYDAHAMDLPVLSPKDVVRIQLPSGGWSAPAVVVRQAAPRSFVVPMADGSIVRRNRRALRKLASPPPDLTFPDVLLPVPDTSLHEANNLAACQPVKTPSSPPPPLRRSTRIRRQPALINNSLYICCSVSAHSTLYMYISIHSPIFLYIPTLVNMSILL